MTAANCVGTGSGGGNCIVKREPVGTDLESTMIELCSYGKPKLFKCTNGWHCWVEMNVATAGAEYSVKSEFDCATPMEAARQCRDRILMAINQR